MASTDLAKTFVDLAFMRKYSIHVLYFVYAILLFIGLGQVHLFDWDEINFAECAREMLVSGNYQQVQIDFRPFLEKPPFFIWLQAASMHVFGVSEFAARFPNACLGLAVPWLLWWFGRRWYSPAFGLFWALSYAGSILPLFYFKSGIIDPWFNAFMFLALAAIIEYQRSNYKQLTWLLTAALLTGLAVLTKGPVGLLIVGGVVGLYLILKKFRVPLSWSHVSVAIVVFLLTGGSWFIYQWVNGQSQLMVDFINYQIRLFTTQDSGHGGFPLYHVVVLGLGVFPAVIFAAPVFKTMLRQTDNEPFRWMTIAFWLVLILFSITKTKIVHYSSFCYFPLTFFAAYQLHHYFVENSNLTRGIKIAFTGVATMWILVIIGLQVVGLFPEWLTETVTIKDKFAQASLGAQINWSGWEWLVIIPLVMAIFFVWRPQTLREKTLLIYSSIFLFTILTMLVITPRVEGYSQRAAIEFYQQHAGEEADVTALEYKSYAHLFYGRRKPENQSVENKTEYLERLTRGLIKRPAYFVTVNRKLNKVQEMYPHLQVIGEKNGFVFLVRKPQ